MSDDATAENRRLELKRWEKTFALAHGGRKPSREDIKNDPVISVKYKEYQQVRRRNAAECQTTPKKPTTARSDAVTLKKTPLKERSVNFAFGTAKEGAGEDDLLKHGTAGVGQEEEREEEPTPAFIRTALGPTPQKDGEVLGIFDSLLNATPSRNNTVSREESRDAMIQATPSKISSDPSLATAHHQSRTPQSSGKRFYLDAFAGTPLKRKRDEDIFTPSTAKRQYATPSFLRRSVPNIHSDQEDDESSSLKVPFKKRGLVRSLSSIIQGLKKQEDERMDEEWEIMREMEAEESGLSKSVQKPRLLVEDSQAVEMPLGPDRAAASESEADEPNPGALDANGNPRKVWKKKGLKRQTRRTIMRPVLHKPQKAAPTVDDIPEETGEDDVDDRASVVSGDSAEINNASKSGKSQMTKDCGKTHDGIEGQSKSSKTKKISAQSHANFRRLKIKNKNSKANGRGGRFGRR